MISPEFLVPDDLGQLSVRCQVHYRIWTSKGLVMSSGQNNRCQLDVRWPDHMSPSWGNQRVVWRSDIYPDVYAGINAGLNISKSFSSQAS